MDVLAAFSQGPSDAEVADHRAKPRALPPCAYWRCGWSGAGAAATLGVDQLHSVTRAVHVPRIRSCRHCHRAAASALVRTRVSRRLSRGVARHARAGQGALEPDQARASGRPGVLRGTRRHHRRSRGVHVRVRRERAHRQSAQRVHGVEGRHVVPRWAWRRTDRDGALRSVHPPAVLRADRLHCAVGARGSPARTPRQLHQWRAVGQAH